MLSLQHLTISIGSRVALRDVSLDVEPKDIVCIIGEEGSGKSTLLKLLTRELQPDEGVIKIDTAPLLQLPREVLRLYRSRIGYLSQDARLDPALTIERNVALPLDLKGVARADREHAVADLLKRFHLTSCANMLPQRVSRGERQLAALARTIVSGPAILLLDEPFQSLSVDAATLAAGLLQNMQKKGATVIVASADARTPGFFRSPRIATLRRGKLSEEALSATAVSVDHPRVRVQEIANTATTGLVERSTTVVKPVDADAPEPIEQSGGKKKVKITSVGSL